MTEPIRLGELLMAASRHFSQRGMAAFGEHGYTPARVRLMRIIDMYRRPTMSTAADELGVTRRAVTSLADGLENDGLVEREHSQEDRREVMLRFTESGHRSVDRMKMLQAEISADLFANLTREEQRQLAHLLEKFLGEAGQC
ncbi:MULTISPECIES: MarR family winged helix-turn-helix transcriptional regulator [Nonomuraea]|uniref:MarR family winged helix-turn-helix transcriptional regulator n=1 Tax=Nonomuraea mangrovi TaxID=2316207 RepID=A0ABW4T5P9_9ACTN